MTTRPRVALVDYRAGNLTSVRKAFGAVGADVYTPDTPADLWDAQAIVVPGVGHFDATRVLDQAWRDAILARVGDGRPLLGICLGMQWLYEGSDELPGAAGLGLFGGTCTRLVPGASQPEPGSEGRLKVPHVGWNALEIVRRDSILEGVEPGSQVYFTHSYIAPLSGDTVAATTHGQAFTAVVQRGQVAGVQFHPEKSGSVGLRILANFLALSA